MWRRDLLKSILIRSFAKSWDEKSGHKEAKVGCGILSQQNEETHHDTLYSNQNTLNKINIFTLMPKINRLDELRLHLK